MRRCAVLLEYEIVTRCFLDAWQQILLQQYFTIIVAVHFHPRNPGCTKNNYYVHPSFDTATDTITLVLNVGRSRSRRSGAFQVSQGSAATDLRWGENFNKFLFCNSLLNILVKKLRKSVNICQSYRKNNSVSFFMDHSVHVRYLHNSIFKSP